MQVSIVADPNESSLSVQCSSRDGNFDCTCDTTTVNLLFAYHVAELLLALEKTNGHTIFEVLYMAHELEAWSPIERHRIQLEVGMDRIEQILQSAPPDLYSALQVLAEHHLAPDRCDLEYGLIKAIIPWSDELAQYNVRTLPELQKVQEHTELTLAPFGDDIAAFQRECTSLPPEFKQAIRCSLLEVLSRRISDQPIIFATAAAHALYVTRGAVEWEDLKQRVIGTDQSHLPEDLNDLEFAAIVSAHYAADRYPAVVERPKKQSKQIRKTCEVAVSCAEGKLPVMQYYLDNIRGTLRHWNTMPTYDIGAELF